MKLKDVLIIDFVEIEANNFHLFVKVKVGKLSARLLLDTGASKTVFDQTKILRYIKEGSLTNMDGTSVGLGSKNVETQLAQINCISFGKIKLKKVEVAAMDLSHVLQTYELLNMKAIDGVLGSDLLYHLKAVINYEKHTLKIKSGYV
ncbi:MAG: clan AA aspartic protease [Bacteroidia bacterium]|nr:clan AA aspartic protease [Bacteroidia bacterium]